MPRSPIKSKNVPSKPTASARGGGAPAATNAAAGPGHSSALDYQEVQADEVEALRAIYMEDFVEVQRKGAWSKSGDKSFKLTIRASSDDSLNVTLACTLPATYPKSVPQLSIEHANVREKDLANVRGVLKTKPRSLVGQVMIHEIALDIQDILEDASTAQVLDSHLPSLEEERAQTEAAASEAARLKADDDLRRQQSAKDEEDKVMHLMAEEELRRRQESRKKQLVASPLDDELTRVVSTADVVFDHAIAAPNSDNTFRAISVVSLLEQGPLTKVSIVRPTPSSGDGKLLVLKRLNISDFRVKKSILDLEDLMDKLKYLRHSAVLPILDFRIEHCQNNNWQFDILLDFASKGSLRELLEMIDTLNVAKVRTFGFELLGALDFLHHNNIVHGRIHPGNVLLCAGSSGLSVRLSDAGFQDALYGISTNSGQQKQTLEKLERWEAPEMQGADPNKTTKSDVWDLGTLFVQMLFGLQTTEKYQTANTLMSSMSLSDALDHLLRVMFRADPKKRPRPFDLRTYEFLRTDAPVLSNGAPMSPATPIRPGSASYFPQNQTARRSRQEPSSSHGFTTSRYEQEWDESGRLGKGGYGEVVKARNKVDGRVYAIKKITHKTPTELNQVLSEVYLLAGLNHPYVVRYYTAWPEEESEDFAGDDSSTFTSTLPSDDVAHLSALNNLQPSFDLTNSRGGLDFMSSSGYPRIEFGNDDEDDDSNEDDDDDDGSSSISDDTDSSEAVLDVDEDEKLAKGTPKADPPMPPRTRTLSRNAAKSTLYIQMEFCERLTLRDVIRKGLSNQPDEIWRFLRQILEGLVHIHSHNIIHRDLKPENIFIDNLNSPKIGDFGLATTNRHFKAENAQNVTNISDDMTKDVGTAMYVAPELRSSTSGHYSEKVDMYSLGIILFEMCHHLPTNMERLHVLTAMRQKEHHLPEDFRSPNRLVQGEIILSLVQHRPSERPSSVELLRSGKVPAQVEDNAIRLALEGLADSSSPYYHRMMSALFAQTTNKQVREQMWDMSVATQVHSNTDYALLQDMVRERLLYCFRRHGAVQTSRQGLFPTSSHYSNSVVQLLDASGTLVQLPYDLTLPHARAVARSTHSPEKTFTFGTVFRDNAAGMAPRSVKEADFDVISSHSKDKAFQEAEVIKVMDEILNEFPCFNKTPMCFHISHGRLLDMILEHCRVAPAQMVSAKAILGRLNISSWTWAKIRLELRAPSIGISSTSLDDLAQFDFRDTPEKTLVKLQSILHGTQYTQQLVDIFTHIAGLHEYLKRLGVRRKIYISPLSNFNDQFYKNAIMFQCLFDGKKKDVLAAGGRYDRLIEEHQQRSTGTTAPKAKVYGVGINIAWERIVTSMARFQKSAGLATSFLKKDEDETQAWTTRRCDVLVAAFDSKVLRSFGAKICAELWASDISAELALDVHLPEDLQTHYRDDKHSWWVTIKHDAYGSGKPDLKVKNRDTAGDVDVRSVDLVSYLRGEMREREQREGFGGRKPRFTPRHTSASDAAANAEKDNKVHVLLASHKSKKANKWRVVEAARNRAREIAADYADGPVASIETRDELMEKVRETRLSDADSWRRVIQEAPVTEKHYLQELMDLLMQMKNDYGAECRKAFVYNFRTGMCIDYDLLL